jgi:hypothetical protein
MATDPTMPKVAVRERSDKTLADLTTVDVEFLLTTLQYYEDSRRTGHQYEIRHAIALTLGPIVAANAKHIHQLESSL